MRALLPALFLLASALAAQSVDGHVTDAVTGADIPRVYVRLRPSAGDTDKRYDATTNAQGRFHIDSVPEGVYAADYLARGYQLITRDSGAEPPPSIAVTASSPARIEVKLQPVPKISGRVLDPDRKPVPKAAVWVLAPNSVCKEPRCFPVLNRAETDAKGEFHIDNMGWIGPWILGASAPSGWDPPKAAEGERLGWRESFYPGVADPALAEPI